MDMPNSTVYEDVNFELTCIMFNIGAVHAAIAVNEMRSDLDVSCSLFFSSPTQVFSLFI